MSIFTNKTFLVLTRIATAILTLYINYSIFQSIDDTFFAVVATFFSILIMTLPVNAMVNIGAQTQQNRINALQKTTKGLPIYKLAKILNKPNAFKFLTEKMKVYTKNKIVLQLENDSRVIIKPDNKNIKIFIKDNINNQNIVSYTLIDDFETMPTVELNSNYDLINENRNQKILHEATHKIKHLIIKHEIPKYDSYQSKDKTISTPHVISILKPLCENLLQQKNLKIKDEIEKILYSLEDLNTLLHKDQQKAQINSLMDYFLPRLKIMLENYNRIIQVKRQDLVTDQIKNTENSIIELQKLLDEYIRKIFMGEYINEDIDVNTMKEIAQKLDQIKIPQYG